MEAEVDGGRKRRRAKERLMKKLVTAVEKVEVRAGDSNGRD